MSTRFELKDRTDRQLLTGVKKLVGEEREATAQLIAHLCEIDTRRLFLTEGCASLFKYCTEVLHLSESAAYNRIEVARVARKFPVVLEKLAEGSIHLSALRTLAPCLTPENHLTLLEAAKHKRKDEVERIVVTVRPRPDVPSVIRKLPEPAASQARNSESGMFGGEFGQAATPVSAKMTVRPGDDLVLAGPAPETPTPQPPGTEVPVLRTPPRRPAVSALSPGRYKIEFTADAETHEAFRQLQELLRHQVPNGDPAMIFKKALFLLLEKVRREKLAQVKQPRRRKAEVRDLWPAATGAASRSETVLKNGNGNGNGSGNGNDSTSVDGEEEQSEDERRAHPQRTSRHIPAEVKRSVWERDKERCTFVGRNGRRCTERKFLEFHHVHAYALGGPATIDNIALRCRAHNAHESRLLFSKNGKKLTCPRTSCTTKKGCTHSLAGTSAAAEQNRQARSRDTATRAVKEQMCDRVWDEVRAPLRGRKASRHSAERRHLSSE